MDASTKELVVFWRKWGRLLSSGVPILHSLDVVKQEAANAEWQQAIDQLHEAIKEGGSLEKGLAKSPTLFPLSVRTIMKVAETTGRVEKACFEIANGVEDGSLLARMMGPLPEAPTAEPKPNQPEPPSGVVAEDIPAIKLASMIILEAHKARASDIHLENTGSGLRVRIRVDGVLREIQAVPEAVAEAVISRFKIMGNLNVPEKRLPQDGRIQLNVQGQHIDLRVSCIPCLDGENVVLRILTVPSQLPTLEAQAFTPPQLSMVRSWLAKPHGLILVTGPAGSGKTTTLYSMVQELNRPEQNIVMAEDPIELRMPGVSQVQVRQALGLTFAATLRSFMRQDPDVIVATEIRDLETAHMMVHAALTGHLALSTLHTEDTAEALQRIIDIGVDPFLVNSTVVGVIAQRLVRQVCTKCKEEYQPEPWARESVTVPASTHFFRGKGCEHCAQTGYRGRIAIHELLEMNDGLRKAVKEDAGPTRFKELAIQSGMVSLRDDGIAKVLAGITTLEEVVRTCGR